MVAAALNATGRPILYDAVLQVAHNRSVPAYDYGYLWSPEIYGQAAVRSIANTWWSLPVNKCLLRGHLYADNTMGAPVFGSRRMTYTVFSGAGTTVGRAV